MLDSAGAHVRTSVDLPFEVLEQADAHEAVDGAHGWAQLLVADDGPGVPVEHQKRIFDRFYRAESARSPGAGSGLGLSIARGLAQRNGGRLDLLGGDVGATMRLLLPQGTSTG
jgi:signal transduction histidine kinase